MPCRYHVIEEQVLYKSKVNAKDLYRITDSGYISSQGDAKASGGQNEVMSMFDEDGTSYTYGEWNCKDEDQNEKAEGLISEGLAANMIRFEESFTDDSGSQQSLTHMLSFNYAYKIDAVRDWLFEQSDEEAGSFAGLNSESTLS